MNKMTVSRRRLPSRRDFCTSLAAGGGLILAPGKPHNRDTSFKLRYILASSMYGKMALSKIVPHVRKTGAGHIDIWPEVHGNQREQLEKMGHDRFTELLERHNVKLGILTRYDLGPFRLQKEMHLAKKLGGSMIICGAKGRAHLKGSELKSEVRKFVERMKPHLETAGETGVVVGIENHGNSLIESPDSMMYLAESAPSNNIGIALAPYHLPQDPALISKLIRNLGKRLVHFYAWGHGMGCHKKLPKEQELLQMPGRGKLDFGPILASLKQIHYKGWTEIFMHPVPRGIPILKTAEKVTAEILRSKRYLEKVLK